jgi:hypothetical protein
LEAGLPWALLEDAGFLYVNQIRRSYQPRPHRYADC